MLFVKKTEKIVGLIMRVYKKERNTELHYHDLLGLKVIFAVFEISKTPSKREKLM